MSETATKIAKYYPKYYTLAHMQVFAAKGIITPAEYQEITGEIYEV